MERRAYLEAALSAVGIPMSTVEASGDADATIEDVTGSDFGPEQATIQSHGPVRGTLQLAEFRDTESDITVNGYNNPETDRDEVECIIEIRDAVASLNFSPKRARELAAELSLAAAYAEDGWEVPTEGDDE